MERIEVVIVEERSCIQVGKKKQVVWVKWINV